MKQVKSISNPNFLDELKKFPNQGILFEIIETGITGSIIELPDEVLIVKENHKDPFVFVAGELTEKSVLLIADLLKDYKFPMVVNNALIFKGMEKIHWREICNHDHFITVFLHYVDQEGPYKEYKFDKRSDLGEKKIVAL